MFEINLIVAKTLNNGIGFQNGIPWKIVEDIKFFKDITSAERGVKGIETAVIMGRKTCESIPAKFFPLPNRENFVITSDPLFKDKKNLDFHTFESITECMCSLAYDFQNLKKVFVIGGQTIYEQFMRQSRYRINKLYITTVYNEFEVDTYFPKFNVLEEIDKITKDDDDCEYSDHYYLVDQSKIKKSDTGVYYRFQTYQSVYDHSVTFNDCFPERNQYQRLLQKILDEGEVRETRNSTTISLFGESLKFNVLKDGFPLLTTKRVFFRGVAEELFWFIKGETDAKKLDEKGVKIWNGNSNREYLDKYGFTDYDEFCCGPIYGYQWRNFNCPYDYKTKSAKEGFKGIDQLKEIIHLIKTDPTSRRIIMSGWNPCQLKEMVLPPCHVSYQFYVSQGKYLSCHMYQRSADVFLGVPFNIASTALLTTILANMCDLEVKDIMISFGDVHIYRDHVEQVKTQLNRIERGFPHMNVLNKHSDIEEYCLEDFELIGYQPHATIKAAML